MLADRAAWPGCPPGFRRSGRKVLTHDFETLPAEAALAQNLLHDDYVRILCGSLEDLPLAFARLDRQRTEARRAGCPADPIRRETPGDEVETASLSTPDRRVVRTEAMDRKVRAAARSRAPRTAILVG